MWKVVPFVSGTRTSQQQIWEAKIKLLNPNFDFSPFHTWLKRSKPIHYHHHKKYSRSRIAMSKFIVQNFVIYLKATTVSNKFNPIAPQLMRQQIWSFHQFDSRIQLKTLNKRRYFKHKMKASRRTFLVWILAWKRFSLVYLFCPHRNDNLWRKINRQKA